MVFVPKYLAFKVPKVLFQKLLSKHIIFINKSQMFSIVKIQAGCVDYHKQQPELYTSK